MNLDFNDFEAAFRKVYPEVDRIIVNGFDEFTPLEAKLVNSLSAINGAKLFLEFDYYHKNYLIFEHLDRCVKDLTEYGFTQVRDLSSGELTRFQSKLKEELFLKSYNKTPSADSAYKDKLYYITAENRRKEIEIIAKEIKELILAGAEPHKICLSFNLIDKYSPIVKDAFGKCGLPYNLTDRKSLSSAASVAAVIHFLEILENDFYYKNILRAFSSGLVEVWDVDISAMMNAATDYGITIGYQNWLRTIDRAIDKTQQQYDDEAESRDVKELKRARVSIDKIYSKLKPFSGPLSIKDFLHNFNKLIADLKIGVNVIKSDTGEEEGSVKALTEFIELAEELLSLQEDANKGKKFHLSFYLDQLRAAADSARYNVRERYNYGVMVTSINEIRGLQYDYLFIAGLNEGDFPSRYSPEILFTGSFARQDFIHHTEERYHFYQTLCCWKKRAYLSYPKSDDNKELVESNYIADVKRLFEVTEINSGNYAGAIYSGEEALIEIGREGVEETGSLEEFIGKEKMQYIRQAIEIDRKRINAPLEESEYTGWIKPEELFFDIERDELSGAIREHLEKRTGRQFSISQLETYGKCPFKYYAERVLNLNAVEEPSDEMEPLELGSILHEILHDLMVDLGRKGIKLPGCGDEDLKKAEEIAFSIAEKKFEESGYLSPSDFYEKERILGINGRREESILYRFLLEEREGSPDNSVYKVEFKFGDFGDDESTLDELKIGDVKVRGIIDRLDINEKSKTFNVIDYKLSGRKPDKSDLERGLSLQTPLYMLAAKETLKQDKGEDYKPSLSYIYSLKYREGEFGKTAVKTIKTRMDSDEEIIAMNEALIDQTCANIDAFVKGIKSGRFPLSPHEDREKKVCQYCEFKSVCRVQDVS
jgi:ATP-dependent helicase/nuclease subunit B